MTKLPAVVSIRVRKTAGACEEWNKGKANNTASVGTFQLQATWSLLPSPPNYRVNFHTRRVSSRTFIGTYAPPALFSPSLERGYLCTEGDGRPVITQLSFDSIPNQIAGSCAAGDRYEVNQDRALRHSICAALTLQPGLNSAQVVWLCLGKYREDSPLCIDSYRFGIIEQRLSCDRPAHGLSCICR